MEINFEQIPDGIRVDGFFKDGKVLLDGEELDHRPSLKVHAHSLDGFSWGYGGSGPAQLALAIMLKHLPRGAAEQLYQQFKFQHVAQWPRRDFTIHIRLRNWVKGTIREHRKAH